MITAHSLPASFVTHTLCLFTFNTLPKASIPQSSPRDISGTNTEIKKEITSNLDFSLLILLIFSLYFPEPTLGSAKNPDFGADLDLSLANLPPSRSIKSIIVY